MQSIHVHKAKADILEKLIHVLVAAVVLQPPHGQLEVGGRKGKTKHQLFVYNSVKVWPFEKLCLYSKNYVPAPRAI